MAISHLRAQIIGAGRSAIQSAAYRHRTRMHDELEGSDTHRYNREKDLVYSEFSIPENSPSWITRPVSELVENSQKSEWLWNYVQNNERINGQLAREIIIALPNELTREQNIALMQEFVQSNITSRGLISDWVYHAKEGNPHVHLMHTLRPVAEHGLGKKKIPILNEDGSVMKINNRIVYETVIGYKDSMKDLRNSWGEIATKHLALAGHDIKIDMRSYAERGLSVAPTIHLGQSAAAMGKKGIESTAVAANERARQKSAERIMAVPDEVLKIISSEKSTFTRKDIAKIINRYIDDPEVFSEILMKVEQSEQLVKLHNGAKKNSAVFSTKELIETEYRMARNVVSLSQTRGHAVKPVIIAKAISAIEKKDPGRPFKFADEQVLAVQHIMSDNGVAAIVGYAGAGKSTLLEAANLAWVNSDRRVFGAALAGKAAEGLEEASGIKSRTLASWELGWKNGKDELRPGDVFVIDEAGMVSSKQLAHFIQKIESAGAKAVLVGDPMQLQPIEAGAAFRATLEQIGYVELSGIRRQKQKWGQEASRQFARGHIGEALRSYKERGFVHQTNTHDEAISQIVQDWMQARHKVEQQVSSRGDELLVLAHSNMAVKKLNENIRSALKTDGFLKPDTAVSFLTQRGGREFVVNDRIAFLENARFEEKAAPELGRQEVKNGMLGTVIATSDESSGKILRVRLDSGREVAFTEKNYQNIDHGYAVTVHKSQGVTVDNVFVLAAPTMDQHLAYVAMSRHRHDAHMYVAAEDFQSVRLREHYHIKGVLAGELVETGFCRFDEKSAKETPYADVKTAAGIERIYGINLPAAIDGAGIQLGDKIELQQNKERITVNNQQLVRNNWTVQLKERGNPDIAALQNDNLVGTYDKLVASLSRSGAKSATLDFETSPDYRDYVAQFTENRGIDVTDTVKERVSRRLEANRQWINDQKAKLSALWSRAKSAFDRIQGRGMEQQEPVLAAEAAPAWLPATTEHKASIEDVAKTAVRNEKSYNDSFAEMTEALRPIYKDPQAAAIRIEKTILAGAGEKMLAILAKSPEKAGELRGSDRLLDKLKAVGKERKVALDAVPILVSSLKELQSVYKNSYSLHVSREARRRERMTHEVPALSVEARGFIQKATGTGRDMPAHIEKEFSQFSDALDKRFGHDAIHKHGFDLKKLLSPVQTVDKGLLTNLQEAIKFVQEQRKTKVQEIVQSRAKGLAR